MRRDLIRRVKRLETRLDQVLSGPVVLVWVMHRIEEPRRTMLAVNERIVNDIYREVGQCGSARERITTDPLDEGRRCPPEGYLEDVVRELHEKCEMRDRGCQDCHGLEHLFSTPVSDILPDGEAATDPANCPIQSG